MLSLPQAVKVTATLTTENQNIEVDLPGAATPVALVPTGPPESHQGIPRFIFTSAPQRQPNNPQGIVQAPTSGSTNTMTSSQRLRILEFYGHKPSSDEPIPPLRDASVGPKSEDVASVTPSSDGSKYLPVFPKILAHLVGQEDSYKTLFNASLVCKTLSSAALDALWQILPGIEPLLGLLPLTCLSDKWLYNVSPIFNWTTFHAYGGRVQALHIKRLLLMSDAILMTLPQVHPEALLPNLNALHIVENQVFSSGTLNPLLAFLPPSLSKLSLETSTHSTHATYEFLMSMNLTPARHTANITNLRLSMDFSDAVWGHILLLNNLHNFSFTVSNLNLPLFRIRQLTSLRHLLQLEIISRTPHDRLVVDNSSVYDKGQEMFRFQQLKVLRLAGHEIFVNAVIDLVGRRLPNNSLRTLDVVYFQTIVAATISIPFSVFPSSIRHLELSAEPYIHTSPINPLPNAINPESHPLYAANTVLPAYTKIDSISWKALGLLGMMGSIKFRGIQILTNPKAFLHIFDQTTTSLPYLHTLYLPCLSNVNTKTLTLHTLATLASKLPQLKKLSLYVDLTGHDVTKIQLFVDKYEGRSGFGHALEHLFIDSSTDMLTVDVCAAVLVGQFIDRLFPSLKKIGLFQDDYVGAPSSIGAKAKLVNVNWWGGVFRLTQVFQQNRSKTRPEVCMD